MKKYIVTDEIHLLLKQVRLLFLPNSLIRISSVELILVSKLKLGTDINLWVNVR